MSRLGPHRISPAPAGDDGARTPGGGHHYCAVCGQEAKTAGEAIERFGEGFCSESHAEAFVQTVRAARVHAAAAADDANKPTCEGAVPAASPKPKDWRAVLGKALCWGAPLLVLALLVAAGTGALAGAAGAVLPVLAALACPLGMYFMMRTMAKGDRHDGSNGNRPHAG